MNGFFFKNKLLTIRDKLFSLTIQCFPPLSAHFRIWVRVWVRRVDPNPDPNRFTRKRRKSDRNQRFRSLDWLRGKDSNQRPPGYEPDELPAALPRDIHLCSCELRYNTIPHWLCQELFCSFLSSQENLPPQRRSPRAQLRSRAPGGTASHRAHDTRRRARAARRAYPARQSRRP